MLRQICLAVSFIRAGGSNVYGSIYPIGVDSIAPIVISLLIGKRMRLFAPSESNGKGVDAAGYNRAGMEEQQPNGDFAPQREWTRVIVLAPPPAAMALHTDDSTAKSLSADARTSPSGSALAMSEALRAEFQKKDWFAVVQHDPYLAMADIALREKAQSARAAWGLQRMEGLALVVVDLHSWEGGLVRDLCAAVRRWLPAATLWSASGDRIEPISSEVTTTKSPSESPRGHRVHDMDALVAALPRGPAMANSLSGDSTNAAARSAPRSMDIERGRLSRDEIDMLLHMDLQDDQPPAKARKDPS